MSVVLASVAFWAPAVFRLPGDDGNLFELHFRARFKRLKRNERQALDRRLMAGRFNEEAREAMRAKAALPATTQQERDDIEAQLAATPISDEEFLDTVLVDWDLKDCGKNTVLYTEAVREETVENWDGFEAALVESYFDAMRKAKTSAEIAKNSGAPSATS